MSVEERLSVNAREVLRRRYLAKDETGMPKETIDQLFRRVADAIASAETAFDKKADTKSVSDSFFEAMAEQRFMPNSPTLMNAGLPMGQLSACFVLPIEDSMEAIFDAVKNAALIHKSGGGTGFSFSRLRPAGSTVKSTGGVASGPVSFMRVFNMATEAVKQGGTRRGANMGILRVDHPDIEEFIHCKSNNEDITNFNISIGITEAFMNAVEKGEEYELIDPSTGKAVGSRNARALFDTIVEAAWHNGEPGIIFLDRLNRDNVVPSQGEIESTNPCGEQPLLPYESCNLGSINLIKMLKKTDEGYAIDYDLLGETVNLAVHFLDNVIEVNKYPLEIIDQVTRSTRKIGLGVMGFADMLLLLGVPYNSEEGVELAGKLMQFINTEAHQASSRLAKQRGTFPLFNESIYKDGEPLRNGTVTTIAPTGTISMICGCSSGIEPVFAFAYIRNVMDGTHLVEVNPILQDLLKERGLYSEELMEKIAKEGTIAHLEEIPEDIRRVFVCAHDVSPTYHARMQAAFQHHTDNAVSKTVNFPNSATKEEVAEVYKLAFKEGLKGITIYRDGSRDGQVLNIGKKPEEPKAQAEDVPTPPPAVEPLAPDNGVEPRPRPTITQGFTERIKIGCGNLYVTVNFDENGICEVFTSTGKAGGCPSQSEATARLASVALRSGISVKEIYDQLKGIRCPSTIRQSGMGCTSCPDAIARVVAKVDRFIREGKPLRPTNPGETSSEKLGNAPVATKKRAEQEMPEGPREYTPGSSACPECGSKMQFEGGCVSCRSCGYSRCG